MEKENAKEILKICMSKGFLLDKEMLGYFSELDKDSTEEIIDKFRSLDINERVITRALFGKNFEKIKSILINGKSQIVIEKFFFSMGYSVSEVYPSGVGGNRGGVGARSNNFAEEDLDSEEGKKRKGHPVKILSSIHFPPRKIGVKDFVNHFRARYGILKKIIEAKNLEGLTAIRKIGNDRGSYTIIASILNKRITKNKNIVLDVEDMTGNIGVLINHNKKEVFDLAKDLLVDEIVALNVSGNREMLFANNVIFPDAHLVEKKHSKNEGSIAFISDIHIGSSLFLEKNFLKFIKWLNGEEGDEKQRGLARNVKYLFITGDTVDGVGVFPGQDKILDMKDMALQYKRLAELLKLIRRDVEIILCPGQHDAVWVGEPQPVIGEDWAGALYKMENMTLVSNPALIEIEDGFRVLMYHGASMHGIVEEIADLRLNFKHNSPTRIVKEMLKRRHLAPMHGASDYIPCEGIDPMAIEIIPDILSTGDLHRAEVSSYNNILLVSSSCWQSITPFEEKVGNNPDPCKVPLFNMKTREIKILDFSENEEEIVKIASEDCKETGNSVVCSVVPSVIPSVPLVSSVSGVNNFSNQEVVLQQNNPGEGVKL